MPNLSPPLIYLIDDHDAFRESTSWLLEAESFEVQCFSNASEFLERFEPIDRPACIVSDVRMPGMSGIELLAEVKKRQILLPILLMTGHGDVPLAVEAMKKGAANFLEKPFTDLAIIEAIQLAMDEPIGKNDSAPLVIGAAEPSKLDPLVQARLEKLSTREHQILDAVLTGKTNKMISRDLAISIKTVELHRAKMMSKIGVKNVAELFHAVLER